VREGYLDDLDLYGSCSLHVFMCAWCATGGSARHDVHRFPTELAMRSALWGQLDAHPGPAQFVTRQRSPLGHQACILNVRTLPHQQHLARKATWTTSIMDARKSWNLYHTHSSHTHFLLYPFDPSRTQPPARSPALDRQRTDRHSFKTELHD
jgi:hypothetical protein